MPVPDTNASHDFIFAKLHGLWANSVMCNGLEKLLKSGTPEALQRNLYPFGLDAPTRDAFHKNLMAREFSLLERIAKLLDRPSAQYYRAFIAKSYFNNLKTILHYRFFPEREADINRLLIDAPGLPPFNTESLLKPGSTTAFASSIPLSSGITHDELFDIIFTLEKDKDIMVAECALDRICYRNLLNHAKAVPLDMRATCTSLIRAEIDVMNICMLLRNVKTYKLDADRLERLWLLGGAQLDTKQLAELASLNTVSKVISKLPKTYGNLLEPLKDSLLFHCENKLWNHLFDLASKAFREFNDEAFSIAAFPLLIHFEALNIGRIYEGVHFGIPTRDMQDMMIGA